MSNVSRAIEAASKLEEIGDRLPKDSEASQKFAVLLSRVRVGLDSAIWEIKKLEQQASEDQRAINAERKRNDDLVTQNRKFSRLAGSLLAKVRYFIRHSGDTALKIEETEAREVMRNFHIPIQEYRQMVEKAWEDDTMFLREGNGPLMVYVVGKEVR
ncbi:MAG: hypothetical protein M1820_006876 [Bogoriella megaspora]|nr:MAG: hypothetical protein M1820_006876 [Bogoriella megaspora]